MSQIINNKEKSRFELFLDPEYAYIDYRYYEEKIALMHTFVPDSHRGQGLADQLAKFALEYIETNKIKALVYCPFVTKYIERHPDYRHLVTMLKKD